MPFSPADSQLFAPLFSDARLAEIFSDDSFVRRMLEVEATLARVESRLGIIPAQAGEAITGAAAAMPIDMARLRAGIEQDGFPIIELVRQIRQAVAAARQGKEFSNFVHCGATTQDIMDTALILQIRDALGYLEGQLQRIVANLAGLAERHRRTLMAGRTHSQQALPVTFGLKAAGWLAPLLRDRDRLAELKPRLLVVQLGGAAGTMAALGRQGLAVEAALAGELGLGVLSIPWHTQRDSLAELSGWLALVSGSLGKMAQDIILMAQSEIDEVRESADAYHGGSSAMPQKSNPITSEWILAAARANAGHLAAMYQALINEHERGTSGWQLEWLALPQMAANTSAAIKHAIWLSENLQVNAERMRQNVQDSHGLMLAEALAAELAKSMSRADAKQLVGEAARVALSENRHLFDVAREKTGEALDWDALRSEANYLGSTEALIDRVLRMV